MVGALGPGATFTDTLMLTVRPETVPGTYHLQGCANSDGAVPESDEDNTCKASSGTVQVTPMPDLFVKLVMVTGAPLTVEQGESLAVKVIVRNLGLLDAPPSTLKVRLVSTVGTPPPQESLGTMDVPAILRATSVTLRATLVVDDETAPGSYFVQACANYEGPPDGSKKNDCGTTAPGTVTVTGLPVSPADLTVTALTPPPATRLPGETFSLTATVQNHGTEASPSTTTKFYLLNAAGERVINLKGVQILGPLAVGAIDATAVTVEVYSETVPGSYFLQACADGDKQLHEIEEDDNCLTSEDHPITVLEVPDLVVTEVGNPPATILPGKSFPVTETVRNIGPVGALASRVKFFLVSTVDPAAVPVDLNGSQDVPPLASNATFNGSGTVTVRPETLPGSYLLQACADAGKVILEGDEDHNCKLSTGAVQVAAVADLIVSSVRLPPAPVVVARGGTVTLTAIVWNQGLGAAGASSVKFSLVVSPGAAPIEDTPELVPVVAVAPGGRQPTTGTVTIPLKTSPASYFVRACVDKANQVPESSDENNCGTSSATLQVIDPQ